MEPPLLCSPTLYTLEGSSHRPRFTLWRLHGDSQAPVIPVVCINDSRSLYKCKRGQVNKRRRGFLPPDCPREGLSTCDSTQPSHPFPHPLFQPPWPEEAGPGGKRVVDLLSADATRLFTPHKSPRAIGTLLALDLVPVCLG